METEALLTCTECNKPFSEPKLLSCLHTFCKSCLPSIETDAKIACPLCSKITPVSLDVEFLATNWIANDEVHRHSSKQSVPPCQECFESAKANESADAANNTNIIQTSATVTPSEKYCVQCSAHYCGNCASMIHKISALKSHQIISNEERCSFLESQAYKSLSQCHNHQGKTLEFLCLNCNGMACEDCQMSTAHSGHTFFPLADVCLTARESLKSAIDKSTGRNVDILYVLSSLYHSQSSWEKEKHGKIDSINKYFDGLVQMINSRRKFLCGSIDEIYARKENVLKSVQQNLSNLSNNITQGVKFAEKISLVNDPIKFFQMRGVVTDRLEQLSREDLQESVIQQLKTQVSVNLEDQVLEAMLNTLGQVVEKDVAGELQLVNKKSKKEKGKKKGKLYAWGWNYNGQLGLGVTTENISCPKLLLNFGKKILKVFVGGTHSFALTENGELYGWGDNSCGQLGLGDYNSQKYPQMVRYFLGKWVTKLACGADFNVAQTDDGSIFSWGNNSTGQLGLGANIRNCPSPQLLINAASNNLLHYGEKVVKISCGYRHTVLLTDRNTILSWGGNGYGEVGNGNFTNQCVPVVISALSIYNSDEGSKHVNLFGDKIVKKIVTKGYHNLALTESGEVYSWGYNYNGELGLNNTVCQNTPQLITGFKGAKISHVACGLYHSLALTESGVVYSWGFNYNGQLGIPNVRRYPVPCIIPALQEVKITKVMCGYNFSVVVSAKNEVIAWGINEHSELAQDKTGKNSSISVPHLVQAVANHTILKLACGGHHVLALIE